MGIGCGSFDPVSYFSRNACDFLNCNVLLFIDDIFPLSAAPIVTGTGGGEPAPAEPEEDGGHAGH